MSDETTEVQFLPFHALDQFMLDDFKREVIRIAFGVMDEAPKGLKATIDRSTKKFVQVPGFRNSAKAPASLKAKHMASAFGKSADLVAAIVQLWSSTKPELAGQVHAMLAARGWELLPVDTDRTKLPGFLVRWPAEDDFEVLNAAFEEMYPDSDATENDVSLMVVWLSGRLPIEMVEKDEREGGED